MRKLITTSLYKIAGTGWRGNRGEYRVTWPRDFWLTMKLCSCFYSFCIFQWLLLKENEKPQRKVFQAILSLSACISFYICFPRLRRSQWQVLFSNYPPRDFPGASVAKTPYSQCRGLVSIPGQGTRPCMLQLKRFHMPQLKVPQAATKTEDPVCRNWDLGQPKKYLKRK